jgi:hypothetical protein
MLKCVHTTTSNHRKTVDRFDSNSALETNLSGK